MISRCTWRSPILSYPSNRCELWMPQAPWSSEVVSLWSLWDLRVLSIGRLSCIILGAVGLKEASGHHDVSTAQLMQCNVQGSPVIGMFSLPTDPSCWRFSIRGKTSVIWRFWRRIDVDDTVSCFGRSLCGASKCEAFFQLVDGWNYVKVMHLGLKIQVSVCTT